MVTIVALGILFGILYYLLPHYQEAGSSGESSHHTPASRPGLLHHPT